MNYILIKTEYSNGLPYPEYESFSSLDDAQVAYDKMCQHACESYPDSIPSEYHIDAYYVSSFFIDDDRPTGNGYMYMITTEDEMVSAIMSHVDDSKETCLFEYIGANSYKLEVPMLTIEPSRYIKWDNEDKSGDEYQLLNIIRRPYNADNKDDDEYIYDVKMYQIPNEPDTTKIEYVESLECVGLGILVDIFSEIFIG